MKKFTLIIAIFSLFALSISAQTQISIQTVVSKQAKQSKKSSKKTVKKNNKALSSKFVNQTNIPTGNVLSPNVPLTKNKIHIRYIDLLPLKGGFKQLCFRSGCPDH